MKKYLVVVLGIMIGSAFASGLSAQNGTIPTFRLEPNDLALHRIARPGTPFDRCGRRCALLADESGSFEAWAWPLKLIRNFELSFFTGSSTRPIRAAEIVHSIDISPEAAVLTYVFQSFTVRAVFITPIAEPGALVLLEVDSTEPLNIVCGFLPVLQPMWPAGIGGQYAYWDRQLKAYLISEPTRKNHALVGSPAAAGMSYIPAHMLSDTPSEFRIEIPDPEDVRGRFIPIALAGGAGKREDIAAAYQRLLTDPRGYYQQNLVHFRELRHRTLRIKTPDPRLDLAYEWAKVAFDNLIVDHPTLGKGLVAGLGASGTSGRPGFGWFFGGDAYINTMSMLRYGAWSDVRGILGFTRKWQRDDGKMAHELSQAEGYVDWWKDYPYGYIHGDTTPYYICAVDDYVRRTGDKGFLKESWASLKRAWTWCLTTDEDGDGLMDNRKAGLGALEYGALTGISSDIYMSAVWVRAAQVMPHLARIMGDPELEREAKILSNKAREAFDGKFWDPENRFYAYAFNGKGERVKEISPWNAVGLMWRLGTPERSRMTLERLCSSELSTDWGIRSISIHSRHYQPLNYNYGAVWPFLTSWVTTALYTHGMPLQGFTLLKGTAELTFEHALGSVTEVLSGTQHIWPQEAVSHQGFSTAGVTLPLLRGMLGLSGGMLDPAGPWVEFVPAFPGDWRKVDVDGFRVGKAVFGFQYGRTERGLTIVVSGENARNYRVILAPWLFPGSRIKAAALDGDPIEFERPEVRFDMTREKHVLTFDIAPTVEILPVVPRSRIGDRNRGLKIVSVVRNDRELTVQTEGIAGETYLLRILNPEQAEGIEGGELQRDRIRILIPEGPGGGYAKHTVKILIKQ